MAMIIRAWPSHALAIKAMELIDLKQGRSAARYPHSSRHVTHGPYDGRKTCRSLVALRLPDWISFYRRLCSSNGASGSHITIGSFFFDRRPFLLFHFR